MIVKKHHIPLLIYPCVNKILFAFPFVMGFILYYFTPKVSVCGLINLTHQPCPFCGLTRSFCHITHLEFYRAVSSNLLIVIAGPLFLCGLIVQFLPLKKKAGISLFLRRHIKGVNLFVYTVCVFALLYGILRIVDSIYHLGIFESVVPAHTLLKWLSGQTGTGD